jgi:hypothetical protein
LEAEPCGLQAEGEAGQISYAEFDFGFDGHGKE